MLFQSLHYNSYDQSINQNPSFSFFPPSFLSWQPHKFALSCVSYPPQFIHYCQIPLQKKNTNLPFFFFKEKKGKKKEKEIHKKLWEGFTQTLIFKKKNYKKKQVWKKNLCYPAFVMKEMHRKHRKKKRKRRSTKNPFIYPASTLIIITTNTLISSN
jgi:hypothetical protein